LFSLAVYETAANAAFGNYMKIYREVIGLLMRRLNPALNRMESIARGALPNSMIDGTMPIASVRLTKFKELAEIRKRVQLAAPAVAKAP
jgi:hypothetical protein